MSFVTETQDRLDILARKVGRFSPTASSRLLRLSAAVGQGQNSMSDAWSATDVHRMIDVQVIGEQMKAKDMPGLGLRFLEWLRNILIFAPLVFTWYGISQAVNAYSTYVTYVRDHPKLDQTQITLPFLYLWQQGFGKTLSSTFILSNLAWVDFLLLAALLLITGLVNIRSHLRTSKKEQEAELLQEELTDALSDAALCLTAGKKQQPTNVVTIAQQLLDELQKERDRISQLATKREKELNDLSGFTSALTTISQNMLTAAGQIQQSCNALNQGMGDLAQPIRQLGTDHQRLLVDMGQTLQQHREASQDIKQLVTDQKTWGHDLTDAVEQFSLSVRGIDQFSVKIQNWSTKLEGLVTQLTQHYQAQTMVSQMTASAASGLDKALKELHNGSVEINSIAVNLHHMSQLQQGFMDAVRAYTNAAPYVEQGGKNLVAAAGNINQAGQTLYSVASRLNNGHMGP